MVGVMMASAVPFTTTVVDTVLGGMDAVAMDAIADESLLYCTVATTVPVPTNKYFSNKYFFS